MSVPNPTAGIAPDPWARESSYNEAYRMLSWSYSLVLGAHARTAQSRFRPIDLISGAKRTNSSSTSR